MPNERFKKPGKPSGGAEPAQNHPPKKKPRRDPSTMTDEEVRLELAMRGAGLRDENIPEEGDGSGLEY